jgi:hypothetical protein
MPRIHVPSRSALIYTRASGRRLLAAGAVLALALGTGELGAQSLRGSASSVNEMHRTARNRGLAFLRTSTAVRRAVQSGKLVRLSSTKHYSVKRMSHPYVQAATKTFVQRLGAQYYAACGERLVVTSAVRPLNRQPRNGSPKSVHPTGMAVDLRKPASRACLSWLRARLLELEGSGSIEATEEFRPPHFHVAVYSTRPRLAQVGNIERSDDDSRSTRADDSDSGLRR